MEAVNLSKTSLKILSVFFTEPERKFYVNELIRKTGKYPNSIQQALKSLEKQGILTSSKHRHLKLHRLNKFYKFLEEIEGISTKQNRLGGSTHRVVDKHRVSWMKIVNRVSSIPFYNNLAKGIRDYMKNILDYKLQYYWYNHVTGGVYYAREELMEIDKKIEEKTVKDRKFAKWITEECKRRADRVVEITKSYKQLDFPKLTKEQLYKILKGYQEVTLKLMPFMIIPLSVGAVLEKEIRDNLNDLCDISRQKERFKEYLELLVAPIEEDSEERDDGLKLAAQVKNYGWNRKSEEMLVLHTEKYSWIPLDGLLKDPFGLNYFRDEIENMARRFTKPLQEISRAKKTFEKRKSELERVFKSLGAGERFKEQVELLQSFIFLRTYRRNANAQGHFNLLPLLHELAYRMQLTGEEIKYLTYDEMRSWLRYGYGKRFGFSYKKMKEELWRRLEGGAVLLWKGRLITISGVRNVIGVMERYRIVAPTPAMGRVIKGNPACRGRVTGRVKIVRKLSELSKVEEGDVLVAKMTTPDYMMAIHKAVAIVTDEGGVTCHAAIVSREFNLPCIVGTRNATQILSDGDIVEVDANEGVVRVIEDVEVDENIKMIIGKTAYKGKVRGPVRIVLDASDFSKVKEGDILVASQTTPEYLSSLYKVKGFVVDEDSLTSHAMLYAKALRLPSLIATNFARNVLRDGETIELDADRGLIKRL